MAKEVPSQKRNHGRNETPGHMVSPGITHSSKTEVSAQQFQKIILHADSRSFDDLKTYLVSWFIGIIADEVPFVNRFLKIFPIKLLV